LPYPDSHSFPTRRSSDLDLESVICLEGMINARFLDDRALARDVIHACNSWLADAVDGQTDRLLPVTCIDFGDVDAAIREPTRMRSEEHTSELQSRFDLVC